MAVCLLVVSSLLVVSMRATRDARDATIGSLLARQKIEALRAGGAVPTTEGDGALDTNMDGYFEVVDSAGRPIDVGGSRPQDRRFLRRWRIEFVAGDTTSAVRYSVWVGPAVSWDGLVAKSSPSVSLSVARVIR